MKIDIIYDIHGDWAGLYIDGKIFCQDHAIRDHDWINLLEKLGCKVTTYHNWPGEKYGSLDIDLDDALKELEDEEGEDA